MQAHARMGEEGNAGSDGEAEQAASHSGADTRDRERGQYITVSLKPGVAQVVPLDIFDLYLDAALPAQWWPQSTH